MVDYAFACIHNICTRMSVSNHCIHGYSNRTLRTRFHKSLWKFLVGINVYNKLEHECRTFFLLNISDGQSCDLCCLV